MRAEFLAEYRELAAKTQDQSDGGSPSPAVMAVRNLGQPYIRMVRDAYAQDKISLAGVADYLGVKVRHLDRIGQLIAETGKEAV